jgi:predicted AAA+ superfamily ATPase
MPFSYREALAYQRIKNPHAEPLSIEDYFRLGGFPKRFDYTGEEESDLYTRSVLDEIIKRTSKKERRSATKLFSKKSSATPVSIPGRLSRLDRLSNI